MLRAVTEKGDNIQEYMSNVSRRIKTLLKILKIKNTVIYIKSIFNGLTSRLNTAREKLSEFQDIAIETSQTEMQKKE